MATETMRELIVKWREERLMKYKQRLESKNGGKPIPHLSKILGIKLTSTESQNLVVKHVQVLPPTKMTVLKCRNQPPKIIPKETKLSLQRKQLKNPDFLFRLNFPKQQINQNRLATNIQSNEKSRNTEKVKSPVPNHESILVVKGLDKWLQSRGKIREFSKLKQIENIEPLTNKEMQNDVQPSPPQIGVSYYKDLVEELCALIRSGYPLHNGEQLLQNLLESCCNLKDEPIYYECMALINNRSKDESESKENRPTSSPIDEINKKLKAINLDGSWLNKEVLKDDGNTKSYTIKFAISKNKKLNIDYYRCRLWDSGVLCHDSVAWWFLGGMLRLSKRILGILLGVALP
ncbi:uncharacterized protein LOC106673116 isoform X2 [Cimex lectularius]|uniref:Uncharacterized protein n=1 Tax=Cimex lectularius TaxID=79782 RepID=A0A8I6SNT2_CIMLE|nr:uncharacterized protein LOC106673116 isoform X2 [Cimex lectularius]